MRDFSRSGDPELYLFRALCGNHYDRRGANEVPLLRLDYAHEP
jgi:hypothetical protein